MNKSLDSPLESAISVLRRASKLGLRIRFVLSHSNVGIFELDGTIVEVSDDKIEFRGESCNAFVDRKTCVLTGAEDLALSGTPWSFLLQFKLEGDNFFSVAGLDPFPKIASGLVN